MANTLKMGERTPSKNISQIISMNINVMTTILGLFLSLHASAHQEADWGHVFLSFDRFERCHGSGDLEELVDGMTSGLISGRMAEGCPSPSIARSRNARSQTQENLSPTATAQSPQLKALSDRFIITGHRKTKPGPAL